MTPLEELNTLTRTERTAFLAFFAGARSNLFGSRCGDTGQERPPSFGKAECEWVDDWRDFWGRKLVELGFVTFEETEPREAKGMIAGSTCWDIYIRVTEKGFQAREDYWTDWRAAVDAQAEQQA
jgi:hypothetical protein